jgi:hypothetical protein
MDGPRYYNGHFKHYAFTWRPAFTQRQTPVPTSEHHPPLVERQFMYLPGNGPHDLPPRRPLISTEEIVNIFVDNKCREDVDRYLSRRLQIGGFLLAARIESLRGDPDESLSKPMALIDDRNNENVTRTNLNGRCRPSQGPLSAHGLFIALSQSVCILRPCVADQKPKHIFSACLLQTLLISLPENVV